MEGLIWLAVLVLLIGPILGIAAFFRSGRLKRDFEERDKDYRSTLSILRSEIAELRRALAKVTERPDQTVAGAAPTQTAEEKPTAQPEPVPPAKPALVVPATLPPSELVREQPPHPVPPIKPAKPAPQPPVQPVVPARTEVAPPPAPAIPSKPAAPIPAATPAQPPAPPKPVTPPVTQPAAPRPIPPVPTTPPPPIIHPPAEQPRVAARTTVANYAPLKNVPPRKSLFEQLRAVLPLEEVLGMNWLSKIGIVLLVVGIALFGKYALGEMGPLGKVALLYAVAVAMLGGGIYVESKPKYQLIGRTGIGGGWALMFFTTFAMNFVPAMKVMPSQTLDCILMLAVACAMVAHTLRYQSQLVTGLSFLLAFVTVALSQDTVYALTAGAILAIGIVAIALRQGWYELEVFGILASYLNHLYWLWRIHPEGMAGQSFPEFWPSTIILILYWLTFRISYVARGIRSIRDEHVSTVAALLNTALLLAVMKFQSTRPQLAFYALLALGALEFFFGQLPATRRRRSAFIILTVLGTVLIFASVPFKFTGNNIALLWIVAAEVLLVAGIVQSEVVFRRLGLLTGLFTGLLIAYNAAHIIEFRQTSEAPLTQDGILLLTCAAVFYFNAHFIRRKWNDLFDTLDGRLATAHSYIGGITAFIGARGIFTQDWTAVAWAVLMLAAALGARRLANGHLLWQCWALTTATLVRTLATNCHFASNASSVAVLTNGAVQHIASRIITLAIISAAFYLSAYTMVTMRGESTRWLRALSAWSGTGILFLLSGLELDSQWAILVWFVMAALLVEAARRYDSYVLLLQVHTLSLLATLGGFYPAFVGAHWHSIPIVLLVSGVSAVALYWLAFRVGGFTRPDSLEKRALYTWAASGVFVYLLWRQVPANWVALVWMLFAVALALVGRRIKLSSLCHQEHLLALIAAIRLAEVNLEATTAVARIVPLAVSAVLLYAISHLSTTREATYAPLAAAGHTWLASALTALLIWHEMPQFWIAPAWLALGVALALVGRWRNIPTLCYQEHLLAAMAVWQTVVFNLATTDGTLSLHLATVSLVAAGLYGISRRCCVKEAEYAHTAAWLHTWAATGVLAVLAWYESPQMWLAPLWVVFALALAIVDRLFDVEEFPYQAHVLALMAVARAISLNIYSTEKWRYLSLRLITVSILVIALYALARWVRMPDDLRKRDFHHVYSWVGSFLAAWLLWSELQPVGVAVGIAVFGLVLFEWGTLQKQTQLRRQSYVALTAAFGRLFFVNLTAVPVAGEAIGPRLFTVVPIALIYFFVWWRLQSEKAEPTASGMTISDIIAYFGTACITALLYFQTSPEWIIAAWAVAVMALMVAALLLSRAVFLHQATLLTLAIVARGIAHNLYGGSYFSNGTWLGNFAVLSAASAILLSTLPIAFRLRKRFAAEPKNSALARFIAAAVERPEQLQFFAPVLLITLMIAIKMNPGMVTLAWGIEGVLVFMLALAVGQRSYRLTGLSLLLLCVGKIVIKDAWRLAERDRYITFIALGAALVLVSFLYSKYRDSVRQYL